MMWKINSQEDKLTGLKLLAVRLFKLYIHESMAHGAHYPVTQRAPDENRGLNLEGQTQSWLG